MLLSGKFRRNPSDIIGSIQLSTDFAGIPLASSLSDLAVHMTHRVGWRN
jgi:hypothetical protein